VKQISIRAVVCASLLALVAPSIARPAEFKLLSQEDGNARPAIVLIKGKIDPGDEVKFRNTVMAVRSAIVYLEGPGGVIGAAIAIGLIVRMRGFETAVADDTTCASACALIWLGGNPRRMGKDARIGFHASRSAEATEPYNGALGNAVVGYYLNQLGLPFNAVAYVVKANPQSMTWLSAEDSAKYGIRYEVITKLQADRYRDAIIGHRHIDPPIPEIASIPTPVARKQAAGSRPGATERMLHVRSGRQSIPIAALREGMGCFAGSQNCYYCNGAFIFPSGPQCAPASRPTTATTMLTGLLFRCRRRGLTVDLLGRPSVGRDCAV
jgi:hypothetical protein